MPNMANLDVIIPAGGKLDEEFARVVNTHSKALVRFDGKTVLETTIEALRGSGKVGRIVLIGSQEVRESVEAQAADALLAEGQTGPENIFRGVDYLLEDPNPPERVLICTCDLPFLTPKTIQRFVDSCPVNKDFCVPLISEADYAEAFPQAHATFVNLRDGTYTTGCVYNANIKALRKALHHINQLFMNRKSKIGMARVLGMRFVMLLLTKRLTIRDIEDKVMDLLGCSGAAIPQSPPELAYDIDYVEDYHYAIATMKATRRTVGTF
jgi:molybdopterin-guanine dinucleotide biosynthesis protein A